MYPPNLGPIPRGRFLWDKQAVRNSMVLGHLLRRLQLASSDMTGKVVVVTGANSGIGFEYSKQLASMGATVFMACRSEERAESARQQILTLYPNAQVRCASLDLSSLKSVRQFADDWTHGPIDTLFHNAGFSSNAGGSMTTEDGLETIYQVNFLGSFLLTRLLESKLAPDARVILNSSVGAISGKIGDKFSTERVAEREEIGFHKPTKSSKDSSRYFASKLMQAVFAKTLQQHFDRDASSKRLAFSYDPGLVLTNITSYFSGKFSWREDFWWNFIDFFMRHSNVPVEQGVATALLLTMSSATSVVEDGKGEFWSRNRPRLSPASLYSQEKLQRLWSRWAADADVDWDL